MKEFLVGLLFLLAVAAFSGIAVLLFPLLMVLTVVLRIVFVAVLLILAIWLLGKFIIFVWQKLK